MCTLVVSVNDLLPIGLSVCGASYWNSHTLTHVWTPSLAPLFLPCLPLSPSPPLPLSLPTGTLYLKLLGVEGLLDLSQLMALTGSDSTPPRTYSAGTASQHHAALSPLSHATERDLCPPLQVTCYTPRGTTSRCPLLLIGTERGTERGRRRGRGRGRGRARRSLSLIPMPYLTLAPHRLRTDRHGGEVASTARTRQDCRSSAAWSTWQMIQLVSGGSRLSLVEGAFFLSWRHTPS